MEEAGTGREIAEQELPEQSQEVVAVKARRAPDEPTAAERAEHEGLHEPYRAWCRACVAGRGHSGPKLGGNRGEEAIATIGIDYGYLVKREGVEEVEAVLTEAEQVEATPILCSRDGHLRTLFGHAVPCKGVQHSYLVKICLRSVFLDTSR